MEVAGAGRSAAVTAGAADGELVSGIVVASHGHVAVVVDYRNAFDSYSPADREKATAFWGSLGPVGRECARVAMSWHPPFSCRQPREQLRSQQLQAVHRLFPN